VLINGAPTSEPSVFVNITILKSWMSEFGSAMRGEVTSDIVNTGSADPSA
jgi:hypothetical protein